MNGELMLFGYQSESDGLAEIRVVDDQGHPWFVATDVCSVLGLANSNDAVGRLDPDERQTAPVPDSLGRDRQTTLINESGLYALIMTSRKTEAKAFRRWVTGEVLPSIRRTGRYAAGEAVVPPAISEAERRAIGWAPHQMVEKTDPDTAAITRYRDLREKRVRVEQKIAKAELDLADLRRKAHEAYAEESSAAVGAARVLGGYPSAPPDAE